MNSGMAGSRMCTIRLHDEESERTHSFMHMWWAVWCTHSFMYKWRIDTENTHTNTHRRTSIHKTRQHCVYT